MSLLPGKQQHRCLPGVALATSVATWCCSVSGSYRISGAPMLLRLAGTSRVHPGFRIRGHVFGWPPGQVRLDQGNLWLAEDFLSKGVARFREAGDQPGEAEALVGLGSVRCAQHQPEAAIEHGQRALALFRKVGDPVGQASALSGLAQALADAGEPGRRARRPPWRWPWLTRPAIRTSRPGRRSKASQIFMHKKGVS